VNGYLSSVFTDVPGFPGRALVEGVVPDAVGSVTVNLSTGPRVATVVDNAYAVASLGAARSVAFHTPTTSYTAELPQVPATSMGTPTVKR
jgi:S-formylglutathione hydrolase FrmB